MKAVKLIPVLALALAVLAIAAVPVADASDDVVVDFGSDAAEISFAEGDIDPQSNEWFGNCFLIIFIIILVFAIYYGFVKKD